MHPHLKISFILMIFAISILIVGYFTVQIVRCQIDGPAKCEVLRYLSAEKFENLSGEYKTFDDQDKSSVQQIKWQKNGESRRIQNLVNEKVQMDLIISPPTYLLKDMADEAWWKSDSGSDYKIDITFDPELDLQRIKNLLTHKANSYQKIDSIQCLKERCDRYLVKTLTKTEDEVWIGQKDGKIIKIIERKIGKTLFELTFVYDNPEVALPVNVKQVKRGENIFLKMIDNQTEIVDKTGQTLDYVQKFESERIKAKSTGEDEFANKYAEPSPKATK